MNMAKVETLACDNCGQLPAKQLLLTLDVADPVELDLCDNCIGLLRGMAALGRPVKQAKAYRRFEKTTDFEL